MELNIKKCNIITFSRKVRLLLFAQTLDNIPLNILETIRDLRVTYDYKNSVNKSTQ